MYRMLIALPVLLFLAVAGAVAYGLHVPPPWAEAASVGPLGWLTGGEVFRGGALAVFLGADLLPLAAGAALVRLAAFHPVRRASLFLAGGRYVALGAAVALAVLLPYRLGAAAGAGAGLLAAQTHISPAALLAVSQAPHGLIKAAAFALVLAAPLYALVRGIQVRSLARSTFEAWAQARRLLLPAVMALSAGAVVEALLTPVLMAAALR